MAFLKTINVPVIAIFADDEQTIPTCCSNVHKREETCIFLTTSALGTREFCNFASRMVPLERRGDDGLGYLLPGKNCPLHTIGK